MCAIAQRARARLEVRVMMVENSSSLRQDGSFWSCLTSVSSAQLLPEDDSPIPMGCDILVVDDIPANLVAIEAALEPLSQRIVTATSGTEALRRLLESD